MIRLYLYEGDSQRGDTRKTYSSSKRPRIQSNLWIGHWFHYPGFPFLSPISREIANGEGQDQQPRERQSHGYSNFYPQVIISFLFHVN